jgi:hypothetical protein
MVRSKVRVGDWIVLPNWSVYPSCNEILIRKLKDGFRKL